MSFCTNCGAQIPDGTKFCTECGQKIAANEPIADQPDPMQVQAGATEPLQSDRPRNAESDAAPRQPVPEDLETGPLNPGQAPENNGAYGAPGQSAPQAAQPGQNYYYTAPPQSYAPVGGAGGAAGQTAVQTKKKSNSGLIVLLVVLGVVVLAAAAVLLIWLFSGSGKDDPNLGRYNCVSCDAFGTEVGADGEWIELKAHGKATVYLLNNEYSAKWELDGEDFTLDDGMTYEGTLKDGVLTINFVGMVYTFEKEGSTTAAGTVTTSREAEEAGYWTLLRVDSTDAESAISEEDLAMYRDLGLEYYAVLDEDGTGTIVFDDPETITWADGQITDCVGGTYAYTVEDGLLHLDIDGDDYVFTRGEGTPPETDISTQTTTEPEMTGSAALIEDEYWSGKWYGWLVISDASDYYAEDIDTCMDCIMDLDVYDDETGYLELSDIDGERFCQANVTFGAGTTEHGCMMSESGTFFGAELSHADWIVDPGASIVSSFDHMICIDGTVYDEDGDWYDYYIFLRPWGAIWEDVREADTSDMPYTDMMPLYYDDWYMSQMESGAPIYGDGSN